MNTNKFNPSRELSGRPENWSGIADRLDKLSRLAMPRMRAVIHTVYPDYQLEPNPTPKPVPGHYATSLVAQPAPEVLFAPASWSSEQQAAIEQAGLVARDEARDSVDQQRELREGLGHGIPS